MPLWLESTLAGLVLPLVILFHAHLVKINETNSMIGVVRDNLLTVYLSLIVGVGINQVVTLGAIKQLIVLIAIATVILVIYTYLVDQGESFKNKLTLLMSRLTKFSVIVFISFLLLTWVLKLG
jgi:hypothetical protein